MFRLNKLSELAKLCKQKRIYEFKNIIKLSSSSKIDNVRNDLKNDLRNDFKDNKSVESELDFKDLDKLINKNELEKFKKDISELSLAECLLKYECSIKDAQQLDPKLQKRIIIKVIIIL